MKITLIANEVSQYARQGGDAVEFTFQTAHGRVNDPSVSPRNIHHAEAEADLTLRVRSLMANWVPLGKQFKITIESIGDEPFPGRASPSHGQIP